MLSCQVRWRPVRLEASPERGYDCEPVRVTPVEASG